MLTVDVFKDHWDYVALALSAIAAGTTVWAVWVAVLDSKAANKRTAAAEARATAAKEETDHLRAQQQRDRDDAHAASLADRSAVHIRISGSVEGPISGDLYGKLNAKVENNSDRPIFDVVLLADPPHSRSAYGSNEPLALWESVDANSDKHRDPQTLIYVGRNSGSPKFTLLFTDYFGNRWRLCPDRSLLLSKPRTLGMDDEPVNEAQWAKADRS